MEVKQGQFTKNDEKILKIRLGEKFQNKEVFKHEIIRKFPNLVLYSPYTVQEVADFFRLALTFTTTAYLTNENEYVPKIVNQVQKTYFKGISKIS